MSAITVLRVLGYLVTIIMHVSNIVYMYSFFQEDVLQEPIIKSFAELQYRYITCWTFGLQVIYSCVGLFCDYLLIKNKGKEYELPKHLRGFRDTLFSAVIWPSTFLVFTGFWSIFSYDRDLMFPKAIDKVLTWESNHVIHTAIVPVVLWEVLFRPRYIPRSHLRNLGHLAFHNFLYLSVLLYTYYERGVWIYPICGKLYGTVYFPIFLVFMVAISFVYYYLQWPVTTFIWGTIDKKRKVR